MKINSLKIKGFKNIELFDYEFKSRIIVLRGDNGSGKSSVLEALSYLLTDQLNEKISDYINWNSKRFDIESNFSHKGNDYSYIVKREKATEKKLIINDKSEFVQSEASKKLSEIIDPTLTLYSAVSHQHKATSILFETPKERLDKLKTILGLERIVRMVETMKEDSRTLKQEIEVLKATIKTLEERQFKYLEVPEIEDISEIEKKFDRLDKDKIKYESRKTLYDEYVKNLQKWNSDQDLIVLLKRDMDVKEEALRNLKLRKFEEKDFDDEVDEIKFSISEQEKIKGYKEELLELHSELDKLPKIKIPSYSFNKETLKNKHRDLTNLRSQIIAKEKRMEIAKDGKCPECGQDFICDHTKIEIELLELKEQIPSLEKEIYDMENKLEELNRLEIDKTKNNMRIESLRNQIEKIQKLTDGRDYDETALKESKQKLEEVVEQKKKYEEDRKYNQDVFLKRTKIESDIEHINDQINLIERNEKPEETEEPILYDKESYMEYQKKITIYEQQVKETRRITKHNNELKKDEDDTKKSIEENRKILDNYYFDQRRIDESRSLLDKEFSSYLIDKGTSFISYKMNEFFQKSYGRYEITFKQDKKSVDFFYTPGDEVIKPVGMASGFEKQLLAISFRLSLCSLQDLGILLLDEIDSDSSGNKSISLYSNLANQNFEQLFCITHKPETIEYLRNEHNAQIINL